MSALAQPETRSTATTVQRCQAADITGAKKKKERTHIVLQSRVLHSQALSPLILARGRTGHDCRPLPRGHDPTIGLRLVLSVRHIVRRRGRKLVSVAAAAPTGGRLYLSIGAMVPAIGVGVRGEGWCRRRLRGRDVGRIEYRRKGGVIPGRRLDLLLLAPACASGVAFSSASRERWNDGDGFPARGTTTHSLPWRTHEANVVGDWERGRRFCQLGQA